MELPFSSLNSRMKRALLSATVGDEETSTG